MNANLNPEIMMENLKLFDLLQKDANECKKHAWTTGNQFWRRMYVRALFAFIEGAVYGLKQLIYYKHSVLEAVLSRAEQAIVLEEAYDVVDNGQAKVRPSWVSAGRNLRFTFETIIRSYKLKVKIDYGDAGWKSFKQAVLIRNRLTHPKEHQEAFISNEDMDILERTEKWFNKNTVAILRGSADAISKF